MADQKVTQLTEETSPATSDLLYLVDDPGGTPASRKATVANVVEAGWPDVGVRVRHSANQALAAGTTTLAFNTEDYDTDAFHDTVTNNSRLTVPSGQGGKYIFGGAVEIDSPGAGETVTLMVLLNGATNLVQNEYYCTAGLQQTIIVSMYEFSATDYIELQVYCSVIDQANTNGVRSPVFWAQRLG